MPTKYKTREEQIADLNRRIETLTNRRDELIAKGKELDRKRRTRRLIVTGATVEKSLGARDAEVLSEGLSEVRDDLNAILDAKEKTK